MVLSQVADLALPEAWLDERSLGGPLSVDPPLVEQRLAETFASPSGLVPDFSWVFWPHHQRLFACLPDPKDMRFVGGAVRNTLLGRPPDDFDLATLHSPQVMMDLLSQAGFHPIPTGLAHGTITVMLDGIPYEITTLRRDEATDGRHAQIAFTSSWQEDAQRRDFTMNALYVDHQGQLYDYVGGQADLTQGRVRFIGDPQARIEEDHLRILRFFRFWAWYGRQADLQSLKAACEFRSLLDRLSGERVTKEMIRLLQAPRPYRALRVLATNGFFPLVFGIPGVCEALSGLQAVEGWLARPLDPLVRLAALAGQMPRRLVLSRAQKTALNMLFTPLTDLSILHLRQRVYAVGVPMVKDQVALYGIKAHGRQISCTSLEEAGPEDGATPCPKGTLQGKAPSVKFQAAASHEGATPLPAVHQDRDLGLNSTSDPFLNQALCPVLGQDLGQALAVLNQGPWPPFPLSGTDMLSLGVRGRDIGIALDQIRQWWIRQSVICSEPLASPAPQDFYSCSYSCAAYPDRQACLAWAKTHLDQGLLGVDSKLLPQMGPSSGASAQPNSIKAKPNMAGQSCPPGALGEGSSTVLAPTSTVRSKVGPTKGLKVLSSPQDPTPGAQEMPGPSQDRRCLPIIFGLQGPKLTPQERSFFKDYPPFGFILFSRNVRSVQQVRDLTQDLKDLTGQLSLPLLSDEEGGRVARLAAIDARSRTPVLRQVARSGPEACYTHYAGIAQAMAEVGLTVNCAPVLDIATPQTAAFLQERTLGEDPIQVAALGQECIRALQDHGIQAVIKHMPGHGLAQVDSHFDLPKIDAPITEIAYHMRPFRALATSGAWGMSSHLLVSVIDPDLPVTFSHKACQALIRQSMSQDLLPNGVSSEAASFDDASTPFLWHETCVQGAGKGAGFCQTEGALGIGFQGFLLSDDLMMGALHRWSLEERVRRALDAGHDSVLLCAGSPREWLPALRGVEEMRPDQLARAVLPPARQPAS